MQNSIILYHSDYKKKIVEIILISPSVFDILGIPETNLRGRNTRTALSVRRSSWLEAAIVIILENKRLCCVSQPHPYSYKKLHCKGNWARDHAVCLKFIRLFFVLTLQQFLQNQVHHSLINHNNSVIHNIIFQICRLSISW